MRVLGSKELAAKLKAYPDLVKRETESLLRQEARAVCVELARQTLPGPGFDFPRKFQWQIVGEIRQVFASRDQPNTVFAMLQHHAPQLANAYWNAWKSRKLSVMQDILRRANLPEGLNRADHKASRTGPRGHVAARPNGPASLANAASARKYVNEKIATIGFAKAGWVAAALSLGGRIRSNTRAADGTRSTAEKIPAWIRKIANKNKGIGGSRMTEDKSVIRLEVFTNVRHAQEALPNDLMQVGLENAESNFIRALRHSMAALNRKLFKAA